MAKSKSGGTRSYIRGRVGADVYSIGKDGLGKKQQVVRSLAETVANPQTEAQMRGRMIMSTVMQAVAELRPIIDHSFDNVVGKQPNISEFIRQNYALIKADVAANPASGNSFGLNMYQEKGAKQGAYVISAGKANVPSSAVLTKASGVLAITLPSDAITMAGLKSALDFGADDYITLVGIASNGTAAYVRLHIDQTLADSTAINSSNIDSVFNIDGNVTPTIAITSNVISVTIASIANCCAIIVTKKTSSGFEHSEAVLGAGTDLSYNANTALPTYPIGSEMFLNGGDQSFNPAPSPTPTPTENPTLSFTAASGISDVSVQAGGASITSGSQVAAGTLITISGVVAESGYHMEATLNGSAMTLSQSGTTYSGTVSMPNTNATIVMTKVQDSPTPTPGDRSLTVDGNAGTIGGTTNVSGESDVVLVLTLPENDSWIGKKVGYINTESYVTPFGTLAQGQNTITVNSYVFDDVNPCIVQVGTTSGGSWVGSPETLQTITKQ